MPRNSRGVARPFARSTPSNLPVAVFVKSPPGDPAVRGDENLTASELGVRGMAIGSVAIGESRGRGGGGGDGGWAETRGRRREWQTPPSPDCRTASTPRTASSGRSGLHKWTAVSPARRPAPGTATRNPWANQIAPSCTAHPVSFSRLARAVHLCSCAPLPLVEYSRQTILKVLGRPPALESGAQRHTQTAGVGHRQSQQSRSAHCPFRTPPYASTQSNSRQYE